MFAGIEDGNNRKFKEGTFMVYYENRVAARVYPLDLNKTIAQILDEKL